MKILFLDFDGVVNTHNAMGNGYCGIEREKVNLLNRVLDETDCRIVISSAWRYMVLCGDMTLRGFEHMLLTHGLKCYNKVIGCTPADENVESRGLQISEWINNSLPGILENIGQTQFKYVVVDDLDDCNGIKISGAGHSIVQTDGKVGLTNENCNELIRILNEN